MKFVPPLIDSLKRFFPPLDVVLFSDKPEPYADINIEIENLGWPRATLMRYHSILKWRRIFDDYAYVYYMDVDMLVESPVHREEICVDGLVATLHPGFVTTFERDKNSTAYVEGDNHNYYQGCFVGGKRNAFLSMCETITKNIDQDDRNGVMAIYHDESHLNRYMIDHPPCKILSPAYCFPGPAHIRTPERWTNEDLSTFVPKIRHIEKLDQAEWKS